jgi:hypothetical protein
LVNGNDIIFSFQFSGIDFSVFAHNIHHNIEQVVSVSQPHFINSNKDSLKLLLVKNE